MPAVESDPAQPTILTHSRDELIAHAYLQLTYLANWRTTPGVFHKEKRECLELADAWLDYLLELKSE